MLDIRRPFLHELDGVRGHALAADLSSYDYESQSDRPEPGLSTVHSEQLVQHQ